MILPIPSPRSAGIGIVRRVGPAEPDRRRPRSRDSGDRDLRADRRPTTHDRLGRPLLTGLARVGVHHRDASREHPRPACAP